MSRGGLDKFLFRFDKEAGLQAALLDKSDAAFEGFDLNAEERRALLDGDLATLFEWSVHPLLIRNFGATIGVRYVDAFAARGITA